MKKANYTKVQGDYARAMADLTDEAVTNANNVSNLLL